MRSIFGILIIVFGLLTGVWTLVSTFPGGLALQIQPLLIYGASMFLAGLGSFALVMLGVMMLYEQALHVNSITPDRTVPKPARTDQSAPE